MNRAALKILFTAREMAMMLFTYELAALGVAMVLFLFLMDRRDYRRKRSTASTPPASHQTVDGTAEPASE
jgi:divalent metal cation (Fe/Co/Zn/Cd) transporter